MDPKPGDVTAADAEAFRRAVDRPVRLVREGETGWPPLSPDEAPPFPVDALPSRMADWVLAVAEETQTPADLAAIAGLGVLSAAALGAPPVDCGWDEEPVLHILVAMRSGEKKSAVLEAARRPLRRLEREQRQDAEEEVRWDEKQIKLRRDEESELLKQLRTEKDAGKRGVAEDELRAIDEKIAELGEPVVPRCWLMTRRPRRWQCFSRSTARWRCYPPSRRSWTTSSTADTGRTARPTCTWYVRRTPASHRRRTARNVSMTLTGRF
jgi:hypothetical protein